MSVIRPNTDELGAIANSLGIRLTAQQLDDYQCVLQANFDAYDVLDQQPDFLPEVTYPRSAGHVPSAAQNRLGAWQCQAHIQGNSAGPLSGKTLVIKDNIAVAGLPMLNGSFTLDGYRPEVDATVVTRLLDAGASVAGKAVCEALCFSGDRTPLPADRCTTRCVRATPPAVRPQVVQRWSPRVKSIWRWAAIRADRCASPPRSVACME